MKYPSFEHIPTPFSPKCTPSPQGLDLSSAFYTNVYKSYIFASRLCSLLENGSALSCIHILQINIDEHISRQQYFLNQNSIYKSNLTHLILYSIHNTRPCKKININGEKSLFSEENVPETYHCYTSGGVLYIYLFIYMVFYHSLCSRAPNSKNYMIMYM